MSIWQKLLICALAMNPVAVIGALASGNSSWMVYGNVFGCVVFGYVLAKRD